MGLRVALYNKGKCVHPPLYIIIFGMLLGQCIGYKECMYHEFKSFCLRCNLYDYFVQEEIESIVHTGVLQNSDTFNTMIYDTLLLYVSLYVPKYASGFSNRVMERNGVLHFGVNDDGEITGIPFLGTIDVARIQQYVDDTCQYMLRAVGNVEAGMYFKNIRVELVELDVDCTIRDVRKELIADMMLQKQKYNAAYVKYLRQHDKWVYTLRSYTRKLEIVIQDPKIKSELIMYISSSTNTTPEIRAKAIQHVRDAQHTNITYQYITEHVNDPTHYIYWLLPFKDDVMEQLVKMRPIPPPGTKCTTNIGHTLLTQLSNLRHIFIKSNPDIKYYMIKIHLPCNIQPGSFLQYKAYKAFKPYKAYKAYKPFKSYKTLKSYTGVQDDTFSWSTRCRESNDMGPYLGIVDT